MTIPNILFFLCSSFLGSVIQAVSGFGFGIFVMTLFPYILPSSTSTALSSMLSLASSTVLTIRLRDKCNWKRIAMPIIGYFIVSSVAISISVQSADDIYKKLLALVLIGLAVYFLFFSQRIKIPPTPLMGLLAGAIGGILGGFFAMGGPPVVLYLLNTGDDNDQYMVNIQTYFTVTNAYSFVVRAANGIITGEVMLWWCLGVPAMMLGVYVGRKLFKRLNPAMLKKIVYFYMAISGVIMLF